MFLRIRQIRGAIRTMRRLYLSYYALNRISIITLIIITRESCSESARRTWPRMGPDFPPSPRFSARTPAPATVPGTPCACIGYPTRTTRSSTGTARHPPCPRRRPPPSQPPRRLAARRRDPPTSPAPLSKKNTSVKFPIRQLKKHVIRIAHTGIEIDSPARTKSPHSAAEFLTKLPSAAAAFARVLSSSSPNRRTNGGTATLNSGYNASE